MNQATLKLLTEAERLLLGQTTKAHLAQLDEDALCDLHLRVRRTRTKYVKLYRRQASAQVTRDASRGVAAPKNQRTVAKAEVFEDALARVSRRLAEAARASAAQLKNDRLAAVRATPTQRPTRATRPPAIQKAPAPGQTPAPKPTRPIEKKVVASTRASGRRAQARRDSR
jgi:hypothetical protein